MIITHCNNTSCSKWCCYTKIVSNKKRASGCMHKNKTTGEDAFCMECVPIDPPKPFFPLKLNK